MKNVLLKYLNSCHVTELIDNNFKFPDEDANSSKVAIENNLPPEIPPRPKIDAITAQIVKSCAHESNLSYIKYINLFNNNIKIIENLNGLTNLVTLILSFNEIKGIEGIEACVNLKKIDLNHNFISKISGIDNLKDLNTFNLSNNWISDMDDIYYITNNDIPMVELSLKCNPIAANESYRAAVFKAIPYLKKLDGLPLSEKDMDDDTETIMTKEFLVKSTSAQVNHQNTDMKSNYRDNLENKEETSESEWDNQNGSPAEILLINHFKVKIIQNLSYMANLRRLSLIDNLIEKIEGLEA
jgi:hypothetical protein